MTLTGRKKHVDVLDDVVDHVKRQERADGRTHRK